MHWGHCVSSDLIMWEEMPTALSPDCDYEDLLGCMSGSAIVADGKLWLFYTSVSRGYSETVSAAYSDDAVNFTKYPGNPVLYPPATVSCAGNECHYSKFRDPYVFAFEGEYRMLVGAGDSNVAKVLLFRSGNLTDWEFLGELISDAGLGSVAESPAIFRLEDRWVLMLQSERHLPSRILFATGYFDGTKMRFDSEPECSRNGAGSCSDPDYKVIETGEEFLKPVSFEDSLGRRLITGWLYSSRLGGSSAMACFRELSFDLDNLLIMLPADEIIGFGVDESRFVSYSDGRLRVSYEGRTIFSKAFAYEPQLTVLEDVGTVEIFINGGHEVISLFVC